MEKDCSYSTKAKASYQICIFMKVKGLFSIKMLFIDSHMHGLLFNGDAINMQKLKHNQHYMPELSKSCDFPSASLGFTKTINLSKMHSKIIYIFLAHFIKIR